jgi:hypothetical protein
VPPVLSALDNLDNLDNLGHLADKHQVACHHLELTLQVPDDSAIPPPPSKVLTRRLAAFQSTDHQP